MDVRRSDTLWHGNLVLSVRRTGNGSGSRAPIGGETYQAVSLADTTFYSGAGNHANVPVQFMISGVSVQVPPNSYSTTVTFTVVDI